MPLDGAGEAASAASAASGHEKERALPAHRSSSDLSATHLVGGSEVEGRKEEGRDQDDEREESYNSPSNEAETERACDSKVASVRNVEAVHSSESDGDAYCQRTLQVLPVKETMSRTERNKRLKKTKKGGKRLATAAFATYPSSRGVLDPLVGARVDGMLAVETNRSHIYDYLLEHDENVI
ncbi:hypothetical protein PPTG_06341 [Phytophthora nicotianae INRA-310]|uniref:Uncharacterized protein n=1 Tax=Phytophthora nicotianae (strain INRA-310) TaxID=761204 RepID=W2QV21_PHYN3|nr:hypothetical protein PPTG_06341 [Phytophthora nicotianae INRA-310]ETN16125.1 hypothetical protein PPTG_06341 [Phytophthora nicotianae INRA-310]